MYKETGLPPSISKTRSTWWLNRPVLQQGITLHWSPAAVFWQDDQRSVLCALSDSQPGDSTGTTVTVVMRKCTMWELVLESCQLSSSSSWSENAFCHLSVMMSVSRAGRQSRQRSSCSSWPSWQSSHPRLLSIRPADLPSSGTECHPSPWQIGAHDLRPLLLFFWCLKEKSLILASTVSILVYRINKITKIAFYSWN